MNKNFFHGMEQWVEKGRMKRNSDSAFERKIQSLPDNINNDIPATKYIWKEFLRYLFKNNINLSKSNHWKDIHHAIVPMAYCDFVMLDKTWADIASKTKKRLRKAGYTGQIATVFSSRKAEMEMFFSALERF